MAVGETPDDTSIFEARNGVTANAALKAALEADRHWWVASEHFLAKSAPEWALQARAAKFKIELRFVEWLVLRICRTAPMSDST